MADLQSLAADIELLNDAQSVLETLEPIEREIKTRSGVRFNRHILPYRAEDRSGEGVVITFADITERKRSADALAATKRQADLARLT